MKKILCIVIYFLSVVTYTNAQILDGYKTIYLKSHTNNQWGVDDRMRDAFYNKGFNVVMSESEIPTDRQGRLATLVLTYHFEVKYGGTPFHYDLHNMLGEKVFEAEGVGNTMSAKADVNRACKRALGKMEDLTYNYNPDKTPKLPIPDTTLSNLSDEQITNALANVDKSGIEGIYKNMNDSYYKLAILKEGSKYFALVMDTDQKNWYHGDVKAVFENLRKDYYNVTYLKNNYQKIESVIQLNDEGTLKIGDYNYIKIYPNN